MSVRVFEWWSSPMLTTENWRPLADAELLKFPGGEWHVKVSGQKTGLYGSYVAILNGATADDLFALAVLVDAVRRDGGEISAAIPYFPGARQDRRQKGEALSAKVYADFVNGLDLDRVYVVDPHSPVIVALLDNVVVVDITNDIAEKLKAWQVDAIIIPDAGAAKRAQAVADAMGVPTVQASKKRDPNTGKLSSFEVTIPNHSKKYAIVDDICDGGGTFAGLAEASDLKPENLVLFVTHGIFSGMAEFTLPKWFGKTFTTNSIDHDHIEDWHGFEEININNLLLGGQGL